MGVHRVRCFCVRGGGLRCEWGDSWEYPYTAFLKRKLSRSGIELGPVCLPALPLARLHVASVTKFMRRLELSCLSARHTLVPFSQTSLNPPPPPPTTTTTPPPPPPPSCLSGGGGAGIGSGGRSRIFYQQCAIVAVLVLLTMMTWRRLWSFISSVSVSESLVCYWKL